VVREIVDRVRVSLRTWKRDNGITDEYPEVTALVASQISEDLLGRTYQLTQEIFQRNQDVIMGLMDNQAKQRSLNQRMTHARAGRQAKQEQRKQVYQEAASHFPNWHDLVNPLSARERDAESVSITLLDDAVLEAHVSYSTETELEMKFLEELNRLAQIPQADMTNRNDSNFPTVLRFAFLLSSTSAASLRLARRFMRLPCPTTVSNCSKSEIDNARCSLSEMDNLDDQITTFIQMNSLPAGTPVSVAVDAMAMSADRSCLPGKAADHSFVIYGQPLDRRYRCLPLHVITAESGQASEEVRAVVDEVCIRLRSRGLIVKYLCTDGDPGYNKYHTTFFAEWYTRFLDGGLSSALDHASQNTILPAGDFLHLWKLFCNRVKNHTVTLSPDSNVLFNLSADSLEALLKLGVALQDRSSIGKMRDSYALQLFSLKNCLKCLEQEQTNELMYLLPWALQEEVLRNPSLRRE
jgi:hypothetical protein